MVVRNLSPEKAVTLVVVVLVVIIKFVFMNTTDKKTPEEKAEDFYKNREWDAYSFKQSVLQTYLAGHVAALSSGGSNCIEGDEEKVQKLRKICSVWLRSYNNVYESTNEMVDEILEVINDN